MSTLDRCYNVFDLREAAKRRLPRAVFEFVDRSTEDELALRNNRAAFEKIKLKHRALVDVSGRSTKTTLFGKEISLPMAIAPTGAAGLCWHEGELELAKAAAKAKIPFTLATGAMTSMEKIAKEAGQFRRPVVPALCLEAAGTVLSVDRACQEQRVRGADRYRPIPSCRRTASITRKNGFLLPFTPTWRFTCDIMQHPVWFTNVLMKYFTTIGMPRNENYPDPYRRPSAPIPAPREVMRQDFAELGRHQDFPRQMAGHSDAERHQPSGRCAEGDQLWRGRDHRVQPRRPQHGQRGGHDRHAAGNRRGGRRQG